MRISDWSSDVCSSDLVRAGVQQAHVILTNPTHFAVALRYDRATDRAPVVVAKGKGLVAEVIRELDAANKVPVLSSPLLARAVYFTSRAGQEIRDDLFVAVSSLLAVAFKIGHAQCREREGHWV